MIKRGNVSTWVHEKKTCGWNGNKTPRRRSGRSRHPHPDKHPHTRTKGERERIRTRRKHSAGTKEREREKKKELRGRKEQRARTFGNLDHFFRFLWRVSVERKGRCFFKANALEKFWSQNALENFGLFFFSFCVVFLLPRILSCLFWFDLRWWRKKRASDDARKTEEASALFSLKETSVCM